MIEYSGSGATARTAVALVGVNKSTAAYYFLRLRVLITQALAEETPDESYFDGRRKGKRERGAAGKEPMFGIPKHEGHAYTQVIPSMKTQTLLGVMQDRIVQDSIVYTDTYRIL